MNPIVLVGGAGYLGQRIARILAHDGVAFSVLDPNIYDYPLPPCVAHNLIDEDVRSLDPQDFFGTTVIWLASPHDFPKDDEQTRNIARELMVELPVRICMQARRFVYLSSATVELNDHLTLYREYKRQGEVAMLRCEHSHRHENAVAIIRPGTLHGDMARGWANRPETAPNRWGATGSLPDSYYVRRTAPVLQVARACVANARTHFSICIHCIGDRTTAEDLVAGFPRESFFRDRQPFDVPRRDLEGQFRKYYNL